MNIEIKNIQVFEKLSHETNAFHCMIYADGKCIGEAENDGHGGPNHHDAVRGKDGPDWSGMIAAEDYCKSLPAVVSEYNGEKYSNPCNLDHIINTAVEEYRNKKEARRMENIAIRHSARAVVVVKREEGVIKAIAYQQYKKPWTIAMLLEDAKGRALIQKAVVGLLNDNPGYELFNTNIPTELTVK